MGTVSVVGDARVLTGLAPAGSGARVLVVDDEEAIRSLLGLALAAEGLEIDLAGTAADGLRRALSGAYDLVILDLLMPGMDGFTVLRRLMRDRPDQPVLILSGLADVRCKVDCFDLGARDYLTKPFSVEELLARVRNQLRGDTRERLIRAGQLTLHLGRMAADIGGGPLPLTRLEFLVLKELMEHAGQPVPHDQLLESVWGYDKGLRSNVVRVCVLRLRSKIGDHLIKTVRGEGYQLTAAAVT